MKNNIAHSTSVQPSTAQTYPLSLATPTPVRAGSQAIETIMTRADLQTIVSPLPAFLAANSHPGLLESCPVNECYDPHRNDAEVRLCYRLAPQFFHAETSLHKPLVALLRASNRRRIKFFAPVQISVELSYAGEGFPHAVWSALVITTKLGVGRVCCLQDANHLLRSIARLKVIKPLTDSERTMLGRVPACSHH